MEIIISLTSLAIALIALITSIYFYCKQFRPILSVMVKTYKDGNKARAYNLEIINCGSLPAINIKLSCNDEDLQKAISENAIPDDKKRFLECFSEQTEILRLHNGSTTSCSFGMTREVNTFWNYMAIIPVTISYQHPYSKKKRYTDNINIQIRDSNSFTYGCWDSKKN
ncbi:hypothetical protein AAEX28_15370 [Lentisphaerota bacterium WC36G]|nr:hypothetical protein LJT99_02130 [Lentisphaerae bacterium WC36]